jgi:hypothetical protein
MDKLIKQRIYGSDTDLMRWFRNCPQLPSRNGPSRYSLQDNDSLLHNFMSSIDGQGTREIQTIKWIEAKTRNGRPDASQKDTLWKLDWFRTQKHRNGQTVRFEGVFFLFLSGTSPENSQEMYWGQFDENGNILERAINYEWLIQLLNGKRHPRNFCGRAFRRHHKKTEICECRRTPLGFIETVLVTRRS